MGFRFQRRVRIAPGLNLVASKRGIGVSAGVRGARVSATPSGIFGHAGLPGTGLAYREKLNRRGRSRSSSGSTRRGLAGDADVTRLEVTVRLEDSGRITLVHQNGDPIPAEVQARLRTAARDQLRAVLEEHCARHNQALEALTRIQLGTPAPRATPEFTPRDFDLDQPARPAELKGSWWTLIWPPARRALAARNQARRDRYKSELGAWAAAREAFQAAESARRSRELEGVWSDLEIMTEVLADHLGRIPWPQETEVGFDLGEDSRSIAVELCLPDAEEFPCEEWSVHGNQLRILKRELGVRRKRRIYSEYIHGVALRVLGEVFARLPTAQAALVTGLVEAIDPATGRSGRVALFSVKATRGDFERINFEALESVDPAQSLALFDLRRDMSKTAILKAIEPFTVAELDASLAE